MKQMDDDTTYESLRDVHQRVDELLAEFQTFDNASAEFWSVHDCLVKILYKGIDLAIEKGDSIHKKRFREILDYLKDNTPTGYWK